MSMDSTQTTVASLDAPVFSATKNNESAQVGIIKIVPAQPDPSGESESHDLTYCPKGNGKNPYKGGINQGQASRNQTAASTRSGDSSHRNPANPHRVANLVQGTSPTKTSHSSSKGKGSKRG